MKYDRQAVIEKATNLFWEKGFHATSMRDLQDALDMRPGSIYAAFGSKEGLFSETIQHYTASNLSALKTLFTSHDSPLEGLKAVIRTMLESSTCSPNGVCMLVKTVTELTKDNEVLLTEAKKLVKVVEASLAEMIQKAQEAGEMDNTKDPGQLARFLQMQMMGFRSYSVANDGDIAIEELLEDIYTSLK